MDKIMKQTLLHQPRPADWTALLTQVRDDVRILHHPEIVTESLHPEIAANLYAGESDFGATMVTAITDARKLGIRGELHSMREAIRFLGGQIFDDAERESGLFKTDYRSGRGFDGEFVDENWAATYDRFVTPLFTALMKNPRALGNGLTSPCYMVRTIPNANKRNRVVQLKQPGFLTLPLDLGYVAFGYDLMLANLPETVNPLPYPHDDHITVERQIEGWELFKHGYVRVHNRVHSRT